MSTVIPNNILKRMDPKDRAALGKAGLTADECRERFDRGEEKKLQALIANFLSLREIYFETDRMDRKTSGKVGRPDFRICYRGRWIAIEVKADGGRLSDAQRDTLEAIRKAGGLAIVAFGLPAVQEALRRIDSEIRVCQDALIATGWKEKEPTSKELLTVQEETVLTLPERPTQP